MQPQTTSYTQFLQLFNDKEINSCLNDKTKADLSQYTAKCALSNNTPYHTSINHKTPIAQFLTDVYSLTVLDRNWNIEEFLSNSKFLSLIPRDSTIFKIIRQHLSDYTKSFYNPINPQYLMQSNQTAEGDDDDDDDDEADDDDIDHIQTPFGSEGAIRHDMNRILHYTHYIDNALWALPKMRQIDTVFIPHKVPWIKPKYFKKLGIKYQKLEQADNEFTAARNPWISMLRAFTQSMFSSSNRRNRRCVILVMSDSDYLSNDEVYIFEPLEYNKMCSEILNYTEIPFISNTKSDKLIQKLSTDYDALCVSLHRHSNNTKRLYLSYQSYGTRVFRDSLKSALRPFCAEHSELKYHLISADHEEFEDPQFHAFVNTYFADLKLVRPDLNNYFLENSNGDSHDSRWSQELYGFMRRDIITSYDMVKEYMHIPSHFEQYQLLNTIINDYCESVGYDAENKFIQYIEENEFMECPLEYNLGSNINPDDCDFTSFDKQFPIKRIDGDTEEYIFYFLQHCYLYGIAPNQN